MDNTNVGSNVLVEFLYNVTNRCNCKCKHCNPIVYTGKEKELSSKEMIEQYEQSEILRKNSISIGGGEPFIKEDLEELVLYLDERNIPCVITTNGWFTERVVSLISKLKDNKTVRFAVSIDGTEEHHDSIRGSIGGYRRAIETVHAIQDREFKVQVNTVIQKENIKDLGELESYFKESGIPIVYIPQIFVSEEDFNFSPSDIKHIFPYVDYQRGRKYLLSQGNYLIKNCHAGRNSWFIDSNGDVYACWGSYYRPDAQDYIMGNLLYKSFDEIFCSARKEKVCREKVDTCDGCLMPRDIERECCAFNFPYSLTKEEVAVLKDELSNVSLLLDFSVDETEWYDIEQDQEGKTFRWMKSDKARIYLNVEGRKPQELTIEVFNGKPSVEEKSINLSIYLDSRLIQVINCNEGHQTIKIECGDIEFLEELTEVTLAVSERWKPCDYTHTLDSRNLGIAVYAARIS